MKVELSPDQIMKLVLLASNQAAFLFDSNRPSAAVEYDNIVDALYEAKDSDA